MAGEQVKSKQSFVIASTKKGIKTAYGHFADTTTLGGAIHTWVSATWQWRLCWIFVMILLLGATAWNTREVVLDYLAWPVLTNIHKAHQDSVAFPSVTVCNTSPVDCTKLAFAYLEHPREINDIFYYSQCITILTSDPLRQRLVCYPQRKCK